MVILKIYINLIIDRLIESYRLVLAFLLIALLTLLSWAVYIYLPGGYDWEVTFRPAALELLKGQSPYSVTQFYNPFWILIPLLPIALLPAKIGTTILFILGLLAYAYLAYKFNASPLVLLFLLLSSPVLTGLYNGQIEWLVTLGLALPQPVGLLLLLSKPQTGLGIAIFWFVDAIHEGGWRLVLRKFSPVLIVFVLSIILFGMWPLKTIRRVHLGFNASLWPYSLPAGIFLLIASIRKHKLNFAMLSSPLLSPYLTPHSWSIVLLGLVPEQAIFIVAVIISWFAEIWLW